jgi:hypothetical protein
MPGYSFQQGYELRTSPTLVERRCDGVEMDDGKPCICNADGEDKCALLTRLTVALPELTTMLGWRLESKGDNAARELLASMDLIQGVAGGRPFVPAKLRIVERRGNVNGQAVRYVVPVIDVSIRYAEILSGNDSREPSALPARYTPIEARATNGVTLAEGLHEAETQVLTKPPRVPLAEDDEILDDESGASTSPREPEAAPPCGDGSSSTGAPDLLTPQQAKKLDVLVGSLRDRRGHLSTQQLYAGVARNRRVKVDVMIGLIPVSEDGELHWAPLRSTLTKGEASRLIEQLQAKESELVAAERETAGVA